MAFLSVNAFASDWAMFDATDDIEVLVDLKSITQDGPFRKAWFLYNFNKPQSRDSSPALFQSIITLEYVSCAKRKAGISRVIYFLKQNGAGKADSSSLDIADIDFEEVVPGSGGEAQLDFLCSYGPYPVSTDGNSILPENPMQVESI